MFQLICIIIIKNIQKYLGKGSGWIIDLVIDHSISISMYNSLAESSYIKLPKELDHSRKGLINIQNTYHNECFKSYLIRYLNRANHRPARITKADKDFPKIFDLKDRKFPVKARDIHKIETNDYISISVLVSKIKKKILSMYQKIL